MNTVQIWETESISLDKTLELAEQVGQKLKGGEVIELVSDLGGGKTAFVKGLAKGMGITDVVGSPSYTISNEYKVGDLTLHHFDFYRIHEPGLMKHELNDLIGESTSVIAIEWADVVSDLLPTERLSIQIMVINEDKRLLKFKFPDSLEYLIPR